MRLLLLCSIFFVVVTATYLEDSRLPAVSDADDESEILIKNFNKCSKDYYYNLYTASCEKCTKCPKGKFAINECKKFDNTECASCSNKDLSNTRAYRANCRSFPVQPAPFGVRKASASDVQVEIHPWKNIEESINERSDFRDSYDSYEEDDYDEFMDNLDLLSEEFDDPKTVDAQIILPAARPIMDQNGVLEAIAASEDDDSSDSLSNELSEDDEDEEDSEEIEETTLATTKKPYPLSFNDLTNNVMVWNLLIKFFVFLAYCFAIMSLFITFRYVRNFRRQRSFNVQPLVMTPDQHHDLIRTVNYLQSKRRGPFKYEPLEEFV